MIKKYGFLASMILFSILLNLYLDGNVTYYLSVKYGFPSVPMRMIWAILGITLYASYVYYAIYQYTLVKKEIIIRVGRKCYFKKIVKICIVYLLFFILVNSLVDFILIGKIVLVEILLNSLFLLSSLLFIKKAKQTTSYYLLFSVGLVLALRFLFRLLIAKF